jgi:membrane protein implicated in regulation of membrane protease activity
MKNFGVISLIAGIAFVVAFSAHAILTEAGLPLLFKLGFLLIGGGALLILIQQIRDRKKEKEEENDYRQY